MAKIREFDTGATRDTEDDKLDPEGFLSPVVILGYCEYMHRNRTMADGSLRESDNWQKGIPLDSYAKSMWRHMLDFWLVHRNYDHCARDDVHTALYGIIFNAMGYLHELDKED